MESGSTPWQILAVDDDAAIRQMIADYLTDNEMIVTAVASGHEMREALDRKRIDLLVLDLRLPGEDGMQIAQEIRARSALLPIIILTGRKDEADRVMGLELGADDYLTKPFSPRELLARIRALLRRSQSQQTTSETLARVRSYRFAGWELNVRLRRLTSPSAEVVPLSNGEFNLLVAFLSAPQQVLSREHLLDRTRVYNAEVFDRAIDVQIGRLRRKFERDGASQGLIVTERGAGYTFVVPVDVIPG